VRWLAQRDALAEALAQPTSFMMSFAPNTFLEAFCDSHHASLPRLAPGFPILIGELIKHTRRRLLQVRIQRRLNVRPNHALCVAEYIGH
jgi:hypothetical protein